MTDEIIKQSIVLQVGDDVRRVRRHDRCWKVNRDEKHDKQGPVYDYVITTSTGL